MKKLPILLLSALALAGCVDKDYDLDDVDFTIGVGADNLVLPSNNSTMEIQMADVLELNNSDIVFIDEDGTYFNQGDYYVFKRGADMETARPVVDAFTVSGFDPVSIDFPVNLTVGDKARAKSRIMVNTDVLTVVNFEGSSANVPKEVRSVSHLDISETLNLTVKFDGVKNVLSNISQLKFFVPDYMNLSTDARNISGVGSYSQDGNVITLTDVSTASNVTLPLSVVGLDIASVTAMPTTDSYLVFVRPAGDNDQGEVAMKGDIKMSAVFNTDDITNPTGVQNANISVVLQMNTLTVTGATGTFTPTINLDDLGRMEINGVPDFLTQSGDNAMNIDLYNPEIHLFINSNMDIEGLATGNLRSVDEYGNQIASVDIPQMTINRNGESRICICRNKAEVKSPAAPYTDIIEVPTLSTIVKTMPKYIYFTASAQANPNKEGTIRLGQQGYTIVPEYEFLTPLAFGRDAVVVYNDTITDIGDDLEDIELTRNSTVTVTADVLNQMPLNLTVSAYAIDRNNNRLSDSRISFAVNGDVAASADGTSKQSQLAIVATQHDANALKDLNGIVFTASASSGSELEGVHLNAYNQTLQLKNITFTISGKLVIDGNDDD